MARGIGLKLFAALMSAIIVLPVIAVVPVAFSAHSYARLPPRAWSLRWWSAFFADPTWLASLIVSLEVAVLSAIACIVIGTAAAIGMNQLPSLARKFVTGLFLGPMIAPVIVLAVGLYSLARATGLVGSLSGLVIAHTMLAMPYAVLNIGVSLAALDPHLALAAAGLGADSWRIFRTVTLPLILPGISGGAAFAFVTSFDEVVLAIFLSGPQVKTLPVRIWEEIRVEYTPVVAVAATIMIVLAVVGAVLGRLIGRVRQEARA